MWDDKANPADLGTCEREVMRKSRSQGKEKKIAVEFEKQEAHECPIGLVTVRTLTPGLSLVVIKGRNKEKNAPSTV